MSDEKKVAREVAKERQDKTSLLDKIPKEKVIAVIMSLAIVGIMITVLSEQSTPAIAEVASLPVFNDKEEETEEVFSRSVSNDYEAELENRLEDILGSIAGVGAVRVMVTLQSSSEEILAQDTNMSKSSTNEADSAGGSRTVLEEDVISSIIITNGNMPYIIRTDMPTVKGVVVVAEGGDNVYIKNTIIESVSSLLDIAVHKVSVLKMESK
ncbi:MAG: hypothetical protein BEN18_06075 [Epulopiscium sp. Nuni2H_MBin001]|nr:MAG: hypothetical protein BEN18_06075 [Epulopiscium sp. Nuni2H_MBin001]